MQLLYNIAKQVVFENTFHYYNLTKSCALNYGKIFIKRKRQYNYKIPAKLLCNSKFQEITKSYIKKSSQIFSALIQVNTVDLQMEIFWNYSIKFKVV